LQILLFIKLLERNQPKIPPRKQRILTAARGFQTNIIRSLWVAERIQQPLVVHKCTEIEQPIASIYEWEFKKAKYRPFHLNVEP